MSKAAKWITAAIVFLILAAAAFVFLFVLPYMEAENTMPSDPLMTVWENKDGSISISWTPAENISRYALEVRRPYDEEEELSALRAAAGEDGEVCEYEVLYAVKTAEPGCILPDLPTDEALVFHVESQLDYWHPFKKDTYRVGENPTEISCRLNIPEAMELNISPDPDSDTAALSWKVQEGDECKVYVLDENGQWQLFRTIEQSPENEELVLSFGEDCDLPMPEYGESAFFTVLVSRHTDELDFFGRSSEPVGLTRSDLLGTVLEIECTDEGSNNYTLTWNETKGDVYEIQRLNSRGEWETLQSYAHTDERIFKTGRLDPFRDFSYRVIATGGETLPESEFAALPAQTDIKTAESAQYATVWPLKELEIYADTDRSQVLGTAAAAKAYCVLEVAEGLFLIRSGNISGYIDSNYCLINLPEFISDLCAYDITNSYAAIYMVHEFEIPEVTDTVILGYEDVELYNGEYLVPLLYPVALKLIDAAQAAREQGYRLKIYDAYRPNRATRDIYDRTLAIIEEPLPEETFSGEELDDLPEVGEDEELTYYDLVTNGTWDLGNFLATTGSYHNMGIALDLTIENLWTGEELEMQTSMHDLSWYSVIYENNNAAYVLDRIMKGAGFGGLVSEWWHFQDNATRDSLGLNIFMWSGVSPECWMADDHGWRYRRYDGSYFHDVIREIGGISYLFDSEGYATEYTD